MIQNNKHAEIRN